MFCSRLACGCPRVMPLRRSVLTGLLPLEVASIRRLFLFLFAIVIIIHSPNTTHRLDVYCILMLKPHCCSCCMPHNTHTWTDVRIHSSPQIYHLSILSATSPAKAIHRSRPRVPICTQPSLVHHDVRVGPPSRCNPHQHLFYLLPFQN